MRVAHALDSWLPRTYTWIYNQLRFFQTVEAVVLCETLNPAREAFPPLPCEILAFPGLVIGDRSGIGMRGLRQLLRLALGLTHAETAYFARSIGRRSCALVHAHFGDIGWKFLPVARAAGAPLIVSFYGQDYDRLPALEPRWKERFEVLFRQAALFLTEGEHGRRRLIEKGVAPERVKVHHLGVDVDAIPFKPRSFAPGEALRLVQVASLSRPKKGHRITVEAMRILKERGLLGRVSLAFIGDGVLREEIAALVRACGLEASVSFTRHMDYSALHDELLKHHAFVHPSLTAPDGDCEGGAPVVFLDAQATGMPVISTFHCDIPEEVLDGRTGLLAREGDPAGVADAIARFLDQPALLAGYGAAGREHIRQNYSAPTQSRKLEELYESVVKGHRNEAERNAGA